RPCCAVTSATTPRAPSRAQRGALASPNPDPAPVTIAILPSNLMASLLSGAGRPGSTAPRRVRARRLGSGVRGGEGLRVLTTSRFTVNLLAVYPRALVLPERS